MRETIAWKNRRKHYARKYRVKNSRKALARENVALKIRGKTLCAKNRVKNSRKTLRAKISRKNSWRTTLARKICPEKFALTLSATIDWPRSRENFTREFLKVWVQKPLRPAQSGYVFKHVLNRGCVIAANQYVSESVQLLPASSAYKPARSTRLACEKVPSSAIIVLRNRDPLQVRLAHSVLRLRARRRGTMKRHRLRSWYAELWTLNLVFCLDLEMCILNCFYYNMLPVGTSNFPLVTHIILLSLLYSCSLLGVFDELWLWLDRALDLHRCIIMHDALASCKIRRGKGCLCAYARVAS